MSPSSPILSQNNIRALFSLGITATAVIGVGLLHLLGIAGGSQEPHIGVHIALSLALTQRDPESRFKM
jgi:hypothetical protein